MGLDWMVQPKCKEGCEDELNEYEDKLREFERVEANDSNTELPSSTAKRIDELREKMKPLLTSPYDILECPKVGVDADATAFFIKHVFVPNNRKAEEDRARGLGPSPKESDAIATTLHKQQMKFIDYWTRPLSAILADQGGKLVPELAKNKAGIALVSGVACGPIDFRGKIIGSAEDELGVGLSEEAYEKHTAEQCLDYADRLEATIDRTVSEEQRSERYDIYRSAVKWLRFWGGEGFGFNPWY
jgi:hypothetical protein